MSALDDSSQQLPWRALLVAPGLLFRITRSAEKPRTASRCGQAAAHGLTSMRVDARSPRAGSADHPRCREPRGRPAPTGSGGRPGVPEPAGRVVRIEEGTGEHLDKAHPQVVALTRRAGATPICAVRRPASSACPATWRLRYLLTRPRRLFAALRRGVTNASSTCSPGSRTTSQRRLNIGSSTGPNDAI